MHPLLPTFSTRKTWWRDPQYIVAMAMAAAMWAAWGQSPEQHTIVVVVCTMVNFSQPSYSSRMRRCRIWWYELSAWWDMRVGWRRLSANGWPQCIPDSLDPVEARRGDHSSPHRSFSRHTAEVDWHVHANTCHIPHVPLTALAVTSDNSTSPVRQPRCRGRVRPSITLLSSNTASSTTMRELSETSRNFICLSIDPSNAGTVPLPGRHGEEDKSFTRKTLHACLHHSPRIQLRAFASNNEDRVSPQVPGSGSSLDRVLLTKPSRVFTWKY
jgi:hypothetical protein